MHDSEFAFQSRSGVAPAPGAESGVTPAPAPLREHSIAAVMPSPVTPPANVELNARKFQVLYIFAGKPRKADIKAELQAIAAAGFHEISVEEVDICRGSGHDLLDDRVFNIDLHKIRQRHYDVVIVTPPCNTFSRARCNKGTGPPPIRSRVYPWGFPWLYGVRKDKINTANILMRRSFEVMRVCGDLLIPYLFEFPEDLGSVANFRLRQPGSSLS